MVFSLNRLKYCIRAGKVIVWALVARDRITKENPRAKPIWMAALDPIQRRDRIALSGGTSPASKMDRHPA
jgi:hypothetical protein